MNIKKSLTIGAAALLTATTLLPSQPAYAEQFSEVPGQTRYQSICTIGLQASPGTSKVTYKLLVDGINSESLSGTVYLYKKNSSCNYIETNSEKINLNGPFLLYTYKNYFQLNGSGEYKITFNGYSYANGDSEKITTNTYFTI